MQSWKFWRLLILTALLGVFAWTLYTRGIPGRFGATPAALQTEYKTEHEWAIRESTLDIEEMAAFADRRLVRPLPETLPEVPWDPAAFLSYANAAFGDAVSIASSDPGGVDVYPALTALDVPVLVESAKTVSQMLAANMRNPRAHESAALVIGAFALRDAADLFTDVRWALNRMTAHLAAAKALRSDEQRSPDGAIANVILLALANHQARALAELGRLGSGAPPEPLNAWVRALNLRLTHDWRALPDPATASRLEKLEFFRARRLTVRRQRAAQHLMLVAEPVAADFARIAQDSQVGVEDGHEFVTPALEMELDEASRAYQRMHGQPMPGSLAEALNHRAPRLITAGPQVLPWGAWAEFYQRHIAMNVGMVDSFLRHTLGAHDSANEAKGQLDARLGELTYFPAATARRTKGSQGTEADLTQIRELIALAARSPELIPVRAWRFFEMGANYEPVANTMPPGNTWFALPSAAVPFEAGLRYAEGYRPTENLELLLDTAPHDTRLVTELAAGSEHDPAVKHARGLLEHHHDYDLRTIDAALPFAGNVEARMELQRKGCAISTRDCLSLANTMLYFAKDEAGAAETYARALDDPTMDDIARAADSNWLVTHYYRNQQIDKAVALAEQVGRTGAGTGYYTRGRLYERLGNLDGAEQDFLEMAERYKSFGALLAFYYRRVEVDENPAYEAKWLKRRAELFPSGLQPEPASLTGVPETGVFIYKDSEYSRNAGLRAGDIVVGLQGWRVDTTEQYLAINLFTDDPLVKLTISRGGQLVKVEATSPTRLFGTELQTHPMKGWIKD